MTGLSRDVAIRAKVDLPALVRLGARPIRTHGKEIRDLAASVAHVVKHMATKDDIADLKHELKGDIARAGAGELDRSGTEIRPLREPPRQA